MSTIIRPATALALLLALPWALMAEPQDADTGAASSPAASPSPAHLHKHHHLYGYTSPQASADITASPVPSPQHAHHHPAESAGSADQSPTPAASPPSDASPTPDASAATPRPRPSIAPDASLDTDQLQEFPEQSPQIRSLIESALALTRQNLTYTFSSADPANGGMDCSGFIYYVLTQAGLKDVPRDASGQYSWVRRAENFRAVISRRLDGFELDELKPGDLLFWSGTYKTDRDPPVTHIMIYLGREKDTGDRVMAGSSDGRTYHGIERWGVSVFDFKAVPATSPAPGHPAPRFIGYGSIPGL